MVEDYIARAILHKIFYGFFFISSFSQLFDHFIYLNILYFCPVTQVLYFEPIAQNGSGFPASFFYSSPSNWYYVKKGGIISKIH